MLACGLGNDDMVLARLTRYTPRLFKKPDANKALPTTDHEQPLSLWKNLLILTVALCGFYYAAPNLYVDPALQIAGASSSLQDRRPHTGRAEIASEAGIGAFGEELQNDGKSALFD